VEARANEGDSNNISEDAQQWKENEQFIDGCAVCQQMKTNTHPTAAPLMPIKSHAHRPFQQVTMDFITNLLISNGFDSIFIMVDQGLSKGVIPMPL
jgi:hypothetical protein